MAVMAAATSSTEATILIRMVAITIIMSMHCKEPG
jgi:hypothetical protein